MADTQIDGLPLLIAPDGADVAASKTNTDYRIRVGEANGLASLGSDGKVPSAQLPSTSGTTWGSITGTLSSQTDLDTALAGKSNTGHTHTTSGITDLSSYTGFDARYYTESEVNTLLNAKASTGTDVTFRNITAHQNSNVGVIYLGNTSTHYIKRNVSNNWEFVGSATMTVGGNTVWTSGNDGAGSTLDSDLLDGQQGSYYLAWGNLTGVPASFTPSAHTHTQSNITDFIRDITDSTLEDYPSGIEIANSNGATGGFAGYTVATFKYNNIREAQLQFSATGGTDVPRVFLRTHHTTNGGGGWTAAHQLWHAGNDGAASGLDADLLDGLHASSFLQGNQTITLSGDVTGSGTTAITCTVANNSHTHTASNISDSTTTGRAVMVAASQDAARDAIGIYVQSGDPGAVTDGSLWIW